MPKTQIIYTAEEVATHLRDAGYTAKATKECDLLTDAEVAIDDVLSVQVGEGYLMLCQWDEAGVKMKFSRQVVHPHEIVTLLQERRASS